MKKYLVSYIRFDSFKDKESFEGDIVRAESKEAAMDCIKGRDDFIAIINIVDLSEQEE